MQASPEIALPFFLNDQEVWHYFMNNNTLSNQQLLQVVKLLPIKGSQGFP